MVLESRLCSPQMVRPSSIRSLVLPDRAFPQILSSSDRTLIGVREMPASPTSPQAAYLLSIHLICADGERDGRSGETRHLINLAGFFGT